MIDLHPSLSRQFVVATPRLAVRTRRIHLLIILLVAVTYGCLLAALPLDVFRDRSNYLIYAGYSFPIFLGYWSNGLLSVLSNEPVWLLLNSGLSIVLEPEVIVRLIIGFPASIVAYLVLRSGSKNFIWLLLFLFLPQILKNHIIHLRQGLAISIFLIGFFATWWPQRSFFLLITPLIHSSFFFVLALMALAWLARKVRIDTKLHAVMYSVVGLSIGATLGGLAHFVGARQAEVYEFASVEISGLGFFFWMIVFLLFFSQGFNFIRRQTFAFSILIFYLSTYFFATVSARIFESALLVVLIAGLQMNGWRRLTFIFMIVVYGIISYAFRFNQPWLGFALD